MSQRLPSRVLLPVRILSRSFRRMLLAGCKTPSNRTSSPSSYIRHVMSSAPAEASLFNSKNARRNASTVTWWRSAVRRSRGSRCTNCRIRSAACDALPRHCVRRALWHRWSRPVPCRTACLGRGRRGPADGATTRAREGDQDAQGDAVVLAETPWAAEARREAASGGARSLRRRRFAARNEASVHGLSHVPGRLRRAAARGGFSAVGEHMAKLGLRGPHGPPEAAIRVDFSPLRASCPTSYAAISTCRRLTLSARHTKSHSPRTFASPRRLKRRKPSTCLIQP